MDLPEVLQAADLFVLSSLWEGLPLVLLEAMAAGTAVVGSRIPGIEEVVADGVAGLLTTPGDAEELARALGAALTDDRRRAGMGEAARTLVRERYDLETVLERLAALYRDLVARDRRDRGS
jgi:glycosyltransferase involved in cell wall biosynthesis